MRAALVLTLALAAACASPTSEVEETTHEIATPTFAAMLGGLGALFGPVPAAVGAAAGATVSEVFISKGTSAAHQEGRREGMEDLWVFMNADPDDPAAKEAPIPKRWKNMIDRVETTERVVRESGSTFDKIIEDIRKAFWTAVLVFGSALALFFGFSLFHYWNGSRVSRRIAADDDLYREDTR